MKTRRPVLTVLAAAATLLLGAAAAHAGGVVSAEGSGTPVTSVIYTIDEQSPTQGNPCGSDDAYETATLTVSVDGSYTFRSAGLANTFARVRMLQLDGGDECFTVTDEGALTLEAGREYQLILEPDFGEGTRAFTVSAAQGTSGSVSIDGVQSSRERVGDHFVSGNGTLLAALDYTIDAGSPVAGDFPRPDDIRCDSDQRLSDVPYETVRLTVSQTGDYQFNSSYTTGDFEQFGFVAIHEGEVDSPAGPGCLRTTDDSEDQVLEAGTVYTLFLAAADESRVFEEPSVVESLLGRWVVSVTPDDDFDGRVTFLPAEAEIDEAVVCAPGGEVPAGYTVLEGTSRGDTLVGTPGDDVIRGLGGNDTIRGLGGDDILCGGAGNDALEGGAGEDVLFGGAGNDSSSGGADDDVLVDAAGNDRLDGGAGSDVGFDLQGNNTFLRIESRELPAGVVAR